ncbi:MAG: hypothetical protein RIG77_03500 [Cyclobacteriaceae bacterium]
MKELKDDQTDQNPELRTCTSTIQLCPIANLHLVRSVGSAGDSQK